VTPPCYIGGGDAAKKHETKDLFALSNEEVCERWVYESAHGVLRFERLPRGIDYCCSK